MSLSPPVVVGVDGSQTSRKASEWAADEAARTGLPLKIVHAFVWPPTYLPPTPTPVSPVETRLGEQVETILANAAARAQADHPELEISTAMPTGGAASALVAEAREASLVVLGTRGLGGFRGLVAGSVTVQVSAHAGCPVVVVPPEAAETTRAVVVGVDGSPASDHALQRAFERAQDRALPLVAVHGWMDPVSLGPGDMLPTVYDVDAVEQEEERILAEALAGRREKYPDVTVDRRLVRDHPAKALLTAAAPDSMIVVGSRGRGGFAGLFLGSVSQSVLHHAPCPVEIVR